MTQPRAPTWTPPAGKVHRFCSQCRKWFAGVPEAEKCPECTVGRNSKPRKDHKDQGRKR